MHTKAFTFNEYISQLPEDRREAVQNLRKAVSDNLPDGFTETAGESGISYSIPHSLYPYGYHCDPKQPLPFISIASQKNFIALYHMGIYSDEKLLNWFTKEYPNHSKTKLDMGKSCIRFKKPDQIPLKLISELASKVTPQEWIKTYEKIYKKK